MSRTSTVLYRMRDRSGALLYVGISDDGAQRFAAHADSKAWFAEVARIDLEHFLYRDDAAEAERRAISAERPRYNVRGTGRRPGTRRSVQRTAVMERDYMTIAEAAEHMRVCTKTIRRWVSMGRVPAYRVGPHLLRLDRAELEAMARGLVTGGYE